VAAAAAVAVATVAAVAVVTATTTVEVGNKQVLKTYIRSALFWMRRALLLF
jgi:hypothetical protein